jgi:hypothetical protein
MNQFWWAMVLFVIVGLTPLVLATTLNRRQRRSRGTGETPPP